MLSTNSTKRPYQPGVHVKLTGATCGSSYGWYVVYEDREDQIYLRSLNRKNPFYYTVCPSEIATASGNNMSTQHIHHSNTNAGKPHCVWDPEYNLPTMRSLPDPFGNCAILDRNFNPPIARAISPVEVWRTQTREEGVLDMLDELDASSIVPVAGQMQAALCPIIQLRVEQARAADRPIAPCFCATPDAHRNSGFFVILHLPSGTVLLAANSTMIPARSVRSHRESAVNVAEVFMKGVMCMTSTPFLAGVDGLRMVLACPVSDRNTKAQLNAFKWCPFTEITDTQMRSLVVVALIRCKDLAVPKINHELTQFVTGNMRSLLVPEWARPDDKILPQHIRMALMGIQLLKDAYDRDA